MFYLLWKMWPKVSSGKTFTEYPLIVLSQALDRFHQKSWFAYGYACTCSGSSVFMGQIDIIMTDKKAIAANKLWAQKWVSRTY